MKCNAFSLKSVPRKNYETRHCDGRNCY